MLGNNRRPSQASIRRQMEMGRRASIIAKQNADRQAAAARKKKEAEAKAKKEAEEKKEEKKETVAENKVISNKSPIKEEVKIKKPKPRLADKVKCEEIILKYNLFWQYPVITEQTFYKQNKWDPDYLGLPWATMRDKKYNLELMYKLIKPYIKFQSYYTCCQHIDFRIFINLWKSLGITKVYSCHKVKGEDVINGIKILPCPLYAVNVEDKSRNKKFENIDFLTNERKLLYSFMGAYNPHCYINDIRKRIYNMKHPKKCLVEKTNMWHFEKMVYSKLQNVRKELNEDERQKLRGEKYNEILLDSRYTLCPSGSGPNSIRLWEALAVGSIPILLADTLELPEHELWKDSIIIVEENELKQIPEILKKITNDREVEIRKNCLKIYQHFKNNFKNEDIKIVEQRIEEEKEERNQNRIIVHYCCGSYDEGDHGGVARYDYHIKRVFPNRIFIKQHDKRLLELCKKHDENLLVITDNHLSCDVPANINTILVHHGCAVTTSKRNPDWGEPWKSLCTNGQLKMLDYRRPDNTKILSISKACTVDFTKYFGKKYTKFDRIDLLHASELDETRYKTSFNRSPQVLGNWHGLKKGQRFMPYLKKRAKNFKFNQLSVNIKNGNIEDFNKRKQDIYLKNDIFLQLSNSEGNSYASLDGLICGMVVVSSNVGLFYDDVPEDCFVKLDWTRNGDVEYVESKLRYAWENREAISKRGREWYMKNCRFIDWEKRMLELVDEL